MGKTCDSKDLLGFLLRSHGRRLRFAVLIHCGTVVADRAQGLRRMAQFVASVVPELGKRPHFGRNRSATLPKAAVLISVNHGLAVELKRLAYFASSSGDSAIAGIEQHWGCHG